MQRHQGDSTFILHSLALDTRTQSINAIRRLRNSTHVAHPPQTLGSNTANPPFVSSNCLLRRTTAERPKYRETQIVLYSDPRSSRSLNGDECRGCGSLRREHFAVAAQIAFISNTETGPDPLARDHTSTNDLIFSFSRFEKARHDLTSHDLTYVFTSRTR